MATLSSKNPRKIYDFSEGVVFTDETYKKMNAESEKNRKAIEERSKVDWDMLNRIPVTI